MTIAADNSPPTATVSLFTRDFLLLCAAGLALGLSFQLLLTALPLYVLELGAHPSDVGLVIGVFALAAMAARPLVGLQLDRGRRTIVFTLGAVAFAISSFGYALAGSVVALLLLRALHGAGMALQHTSGQTLAGDLAPAERRGEALGLQGSMNLAASAVGPPAGVAIAMWLGFEPFFLLSSALAVVGVLFALRIREPLQQSVGLAVRRRLFHGGALLPGLAMLGPMFSFGALASFVPIYAVERGLDNPGAFFTVYALAAVLAQTIGGRLSDRIGRVRTSIPGLVLVGAGTVLVPQFEGLFLFIPAALFGLGQGIVQPVLAALAVDRAEPRERGSALGTIGFCIELGIGSGAILTGLAVKTIGLSSALTLVAVMPILSILALLPLRPPRANPADPRHPAVVD